jgi:hypothetical protein
MQKTLLDEFAMTAMLGWISARSGATPMMHHIEDAAFFYDMAEAMMAERAKRTTAEPEPEPAKADPRIWVVKDGLPQNPFPVESLSTLHDTVLSMKGHKVTCSQICEKVFGWSGDMSTLRAIGEALRGMGFQKARSGGKDYYQL